MSVDAILDPAVPYPANTFAFRTVHRLAREMGATSLVEIGVGGGNALDTFTSAGLAMYGIDKEAEHVAATVAKARELGVPDDRFWHTAVEDITDDHPLAAAGPFDILVAMGVLPHSHDKIRTIRSMASLVRPGGYLCMEMRNALFSLVTFNRLTAEFVRDDLLPTTSGELRRAMDADFTARLSMDRPPAHVHASAFDNPLTAPALFEDAGLVDVEVVYFHFHPAMPYLEDVDPVEFRRLSVELEDLGARPDGTIDQAQAWKGMFLASAFLVVARVPD